MKKLYFLLPVFCIICSCASSGAANSGVVSLDSAIQLASADINETLESGTKVAILNFSSPSDQFSDYVIEEISLSLVKAKKLTVVDRREIELIRNEIDFQMSGDVSEESAQEIGKMLGAESIVSGSFLNMGNSYRFRTKVINVVSAAIETSSSTSVANNEQIQFLLTSAGNNKTPAPEPRPPAVTAAPAQAQTGASGQAQAAAPQAPAAPPAETRVYKVGETGPAGGIIFYDKGRFSAGYRYLEAAPVEAEMSAQWSVRNSHVESTLADIGSGKKNTQLVVDIFKQTSGEWDTAVQVVDSLEFNGFDDWFLPSRDELDQMYGQLKRKNLGDFKNGIYWSSTFHYGWGGQAYCQDFSNGSIYSQGSSAKYFVRPIRAF